MCFLKSAFIRLQQRAKGTTKFRKETARSSPGVECAASRLLSSACNKEQREQLNSENKFALSEKKTVPSSSSVKCASSILSRHIAAQKEQQHSKKITLFF
jgi:hypothetical protein